MSKNGSDKVSIIGIGDNGKASLNSATLELIQQSEILFGGERHLSFFTDLDCEKVVVKSNLKEVVERIQNELGSKKMVVLASGDPLFYGIGKYIVSQVPKEKVELLPYLSAMQLAFSKIKECWEDATLLSLHAKPIEDLLNLLKNEEPKKIGLFTDEKNSPNQIAKTLLNQDKNGYFCYVCENLGGENEKVSSGSLEEISKKSFSPLNVLILVKTKEREDVPLGSNSFEQGICELNTCSRLSSQLSERASANVPANKSLTLRNILWTLGIPDQEFYQRTPEKGLITKCEVRVISLSKMAIHKESTVWDIGAGSGSVSIESALLAPLGKIIAIEKNREDVELIRKNVEKFNTPNVEVVHGLAPEAISNTFPEPDAVFIGGSAGNMDEILRVCSQRLRVGGKIVVNVITLENLAEAWNSLKTLNLKSEVTLLQTARSQPILDMSRFSSLNPIFIIAATKEGKHD